MGVLLALFSWFHKMMWQCSWRKYLSQKKDKMQGILMHYQCHKLGKMFTGLTCKLLLRFKVISGVYRSFIPNKTMLTKYCLTPWELWNPLSKAVFGRFHWSGGHELNAKNLWDFYVTICNPVINILILSITPCLLMRIREFIHMQLHNTMLGLCIPCSKRCLSLSKMFSQL